MAASFESKGRYVGSSRHGIVLTSYQKVRGEEDYCISERVIRLMNADTRARGGEVSGWVFCVFLDRVLVCLACSNHQARLTANVVTFPLRSDPIL